MEIKDIAQMLFQYGRNSNNGIFIYMGVYSRQDKK